MTRRDHVRAALIAIALLAHGVYALPLPRAVTDTMLHEDWRQRDILRWQGWLASAGISLSVPQLEGIVVRGSAVSGGLHKTLKRPLKPLFTLTQSDQAWGLFAAATRKPERVVVEVRRGGPSTPWEPVLRRLDPCCTWREDQFRYRRIRGVWDGNKDRAKAAYDPFVDWVARNAFADFPDAERVRVHLEQSRSVYPWDEPDPEVKIRHRRQRSRSSL